MPQIDQASTEQVLQHIREYMPRTVMRDDGSKSKALGLPCPYIIPCVCGEGPFQAMYYWDTFFSLEGARRLGMQELVRSCAENFMHMIESQGFIPSASKVEMNRSQPPVASHVYQQAYAATGDKVLLRRGIQAAIAEHGFWMSQRAHASELNHYGHHSAPKGVANFYWTIRRRCPQLPEAAAERLPFLAHKLAEAESGWDFSPRFRDRAMDILPCDLNALLYATEQHIAAFMEELGDRNASSWRERAAARLERMQRLLWNEDSGCFHDYDTRQQEQTATRSAASWFCLWCGVATEQQAARMVETLPLFESEHGLLTAPVESPDRVPGVTYQWDFPNGWAPLHYAAFSGLARYGYQQEAERLAGKWIATANRGFQATGKLWEKYNMATGNLDVANEYDMPPMLGWTAGTYMAAAELLGLLEG